MSKSLGLIDFKCFYSQKIAYLAHSPPHSPLFSLCLNLKKNIKTSKDDMFRQHPLRNTGIRKTWGLISSHKSYRQDSRAVPHIPNSNTVYLKYPTNGGYGIFLPWIIHMSSFTFHVALHRQTQPQIWEKPLCPKAYPLWSLLPLWPLELIRATVVDQGHIVESRLANWARNRVGIRE